MAAARLAAGLAALDLGLVALAAPLLLFPSKAVGLGIALLGLSWAARAAANRCLWCPTALDLPLALLLAMAAVGTAVSAVPGASLAKAYGLLLGAALFWSLAAQPALLLWVGGSVGLVAALGTALALLALVGTNWRAAPVAAMGPLDAVYAALPAMVRGVAGSGLPRANDLFNPREVGGALSLVFPVAAVALLLGGYRGRLARLGLATASVAMGGVLLLTQAPSAILGAALAVWLALLVRSQRRLAWLALGMVMLALAAGWAWWKLGGAPAVERELDVVARAPADRHAAFGIESRLEIWQRALRMVHDTPYTGIGLNSFPWVMDRFYPGFETGAETHAHNVYLQTAVELGVPGLVALIWLLTLWCLALGRAHRAANGPVERATALALGSGLLAHLVFGTLDAMPGTKPGLLLWLLLGLGAAQARAVGAGPWSRWVHVGMSGLLLGALVAPLAWDGARLNAGRLLAYQALLPTSPSAGSRAALLEAAPLLRHAARSDRGDSGTWYTLADVLGAVGDGPGAVQALREGARADGRGPLRRYAPAKALGELRGRDDWPGLLRTYNQWTSRYPRQAEWWLSAAIVTCEAQADPSRAVALLTRASDADAQPEALLRAYHVRPGGSPACTY